MSFLEIKYVVAKGRAIVTKRGVRGPGKEITAKECQNFQKLKDLGWIIPEKSLEIKKDENIEVVAEPVKEEIKKPEKPVKPEKPTKPNKKDNKTQFGAVKKDETVENEIDYSKQPAPTPTPEDLQDEPVEESEPEIVENVDEEIIDDEIIEDESEEIE